MLDVYRVKKHIIDNPELIELLLEKSGFYKIRKKGNSYKCGNSPETKGNSTNVYINTLKASDFKDDVHGDLITLIQHQTKKNFPQTIKFICNTIGLDKDEFENKIKLPFGGFFTQIGKNKEIYTQPLKIYDENILKKYYKIPSRLFYKDGIMPEIQNKYEIAYDSISRRIIIPHRDTMGNLIGIMGRYNNENLDGEIQKYLPVIPFLKSQVLYGYDKNYNSIQQHGIVLLTESQKSVMKMDSLSINNCLGLGGTSISKTQIKNIHALMPKIIIIGYDEGLEQEFVHEQAKKLKLDNPFINIKIGYIFDKENEILKKGSKDSPMDMNKKGLKKLLKNHVLWL